ncbi:MAG: hypothetical protein ARM1_0633 [Candidatus Micrarchaeota archaeon]|nr:MAG: hypothetical protein ARM1_0633 [Candidatus Micrarchaeota archaeon]
MTDNQKLGIHALMIPVEIKLHEEVDNYLISRGADNTDRAIVHGLMFLGEVLFHIGLETS